MHQVNRTLLQEAVFQLIQHHHDDEQMLQEVTQVKNQETVKSERCFDRYRDVLNSCLGHKKLNNDGSALMPEKIVSKLLLTQSSLQKQIFTEKQKEEARTLICCLAAVLRDVTFQRPRILNLLCAERCLPILFLHHLHQDEVLPVQSYLTYKLKDGKFISAITDSMMAYLQSLAWDDSNKITNDILIFRDVFHQILMVCFCEQSNSTACIKLSKAIIEVFITKLLDVITKKDCSLRLPDLVSTCQFNVAQRFSSLAIQTVLGYSPVYKVADALKNKDWTFTQIQSPLLEWFKMLILPLDTTSVLDIIKQILEQQEVNWNLVLTFLSTVFVCLPDANPLLQDYIMEMLQSGLEDCNIENFVIGYLFARQGCREGSAVFMSYADWFQRTFGNSKSLANSRKTFTFFVKFLTDIVPYEEAQFLKVHILRPPYVPQKCGELLKDYLLLAKTRLADLKFVQNDQPVIHRRGVRDGRK